jgi:hypothetical protein
MLLPIADKSRRFCTHNKKNYNLFLFNKKLIFLSTGLLKKTKQKMAKLQKKICRLPKLLMIKTMENSPAVKFCGIQHFR